jgi:hypothetical protein
MRMSQMRKLGQQPSDMGLVTTPVAQDRGYRGYPGAVTARFFLATPTADRERAFGRCHQGRHPQWDAKADCRRKRRALTEDELRRLLTVARWRPLAEHGRVTVRKAHDDVK